MVRRRAQLNAATQYAMLSAAHLAGAGGRLRKGRLNWEFDAQPTPLSRKYRVRIAYHQDGKLRAFVVSPDLVALAGGRNLPHVYAQHPPTLCLYMPGTGEWHPEKKIVDTIVPWIVLWLYYFEDWLLTGEWAGGGEHPKAEVDG